MRQKLFTVEDSFKVAGREGMVIAANRPPNFPEVKIGSAIVLIKPDGTEIISEVDAIEMVKTISGFSKKVAILGAMSMSALR